MHATDSEAWEVAWSEELSVGLPEIDAEHRRFIALVNELNAAIAGREPKATIERLLHEIYLDAESHFAHEERMFAERGYPDARHHAEVHAGLLVQMRAAIQDLRETEWSRFWVETGLAIKSLLVEHLLGEDMRYRDYFFPSRK